ncbi:hypothetical protein ROZALSC1DRAFT_19877 [Rozella allomycis CSF55]|uniref:Uncharacterized protein n=1 Tax=Rozella allomycis (strain CSF55) TaxID=988480 RepID=A0A4P9YTL5_ROZAC|nr:hypothetical protein ROZALSC1DRAFT_19877 [Rozella allomycis CSF55]
MLLSLFVRAVILYITFISSVVKFVFPSTKSTIENFRPKLETMMLTFTLLKQIFAKGKDHESFTLPSQHRSFKPNDIFECSKITPIRSNGRIYVKFNDRLWRCDWTNMKTKEPIIVLFKKPNDLFLFEKLFSQKEEKKINDIKFHLTINEQDSMLITALSQSKKLNSILISSCENSDQVINQLTKIPFPTSLKRLSLKFSKKCYVEERAIVSLSKNIESSKLNRIEMMNMVLNTPEASKLAAKLANSNVKELDVSNSTLSVKFKLFLASSKINNLVISYANFSTEDILSLINIVKDTCLKRLVMDEMLFFNVLKTSIQMTSNKASCLSLCQGTLKDRDRQMNFYTKIFLHFYVSILSIFEQNEMARSKNVHSSPSKHLELGKLIICTGVIPTFHYPNIKMLIDSDIRIFGTAYFTFQRKTFHNCKWSDIRNYQVTIIFSNPEEMWFFEDLIKATNEQHLDALSFHLEWKYGLRT